MKLTNMHIHSNYSWDGNLKLSKISRVLQKNGITYAAITDHVEFRIESIQEVLEKLKIREFEIDHFNQQFQNLTLLKGIEVSEPFLYPKEMEVLEKLELDYILGSVHHMIRSAKTDNDKKIAFRKYYEDVLKMIEFGHIDAVGHLDYIKRYYQGLDYGDKNQIQEVLSATISNHLLLEVNTSAKRRIESSYFPSFLKLKQYAALGGENVVIGSDAHREEELTDGIETASNMCKKLNLQIGIFRNRNFEKI